ncbi:MAG: adenylate kinase, partial [Nitrospinaceae bacterium]|nr:adenylate kinase [Nitrospinaceae bacterium]
AAGYILDGFPRTIPQAEALEKSGVAIDRAINFQINDDLIIYRLSARRIHRDTGEIFSINPDGTPHPPPDMPAEELVQRDDDQPDAIRHRLEVYRELTEPLIDFYAKRNLLLSLDGTEPVEPLVEAIKAALQD